ncbi:maestro heat-like repeat-containing protein family member 2B [Dermochelys coriacea]|uniref:maestro heat-like repeat-containing protein family member 2B n=1 Tax=Dermochelys coriacea TaxID=27794 RepID=UPI0018E85B79|nr:maestro heat-like repeat-containing protein family member 2B [Dermochelys coriacea]
MYLKLTLIQNVTEISCSILETRDSQKFEFSYKLELLGSMLDFIEKEPRDTLASPVRYKAILAIGHLSKLKPSLTLEENRELLDQCFKSLFPLPFLGEDDERRRRDSKECSAYTVTVHRVPGSPWQANEDFAGGRTNRKLVLKMFQLLETWLHSGKEWERERALQASIQLLTAYQETVHSTPRGPLELYGESPIAARVLKRMREKPREFLWPSH